ncbi:hypothetical protein B0H11DRAFT_2259222 [Mycena galericulata]|nr:hypothetical protein B0H11DRAFT_2259222 [Mycena galericulata]
MPTHRGAVGAVHGVVQACRALATVQSASALYPVSAQHPHSMSMSAVVTRAPRVPARTHVEVFSAGAHEGLGAAVGRLTVQRTQLYRNNG